MGRWAVSIHSFWWRREQYESNIGRTRIAIHLTSDRCGDTNHAGGRRRHVRLLCNQYLYVMSAYTTIYPTGPCRQQRHDWVFS